MKLKNTLGLHIESLSISVRVDQPVLELRREVTSFPKSQILQVVVGNWVIHRVAVNSVYMPDAFLNQMPEWAIYKKNSVGDHDGETQLISKFARNRQSISPVIVSGHHSLTAGWRGFKGEFKETLYPSVNDLRVELSQKINGGKHSQESIQEYLLNRIKNLSKEKTPLQAGGVLPQMYYHQSAFTQPELSKAKYYFNKE